MHVVVKQGFSYSPVSRSDNVLALHPTILITTFVPRPICEGIDSLPMLITVLKLSFIDTSVDKNVPSSVQLSVLKPPFVNGSIAVDHYAQSKPNFGAYQNLADVLGSKFAVDLHIWNHGPAGLLRQYERRNFATLIVTDLVPQLSHLIAQLRVDLILGVLEAPILIESCLHRVSLWFWSRRVLLHRLDLLFLVYRFLLRAYIDIHRTLFISCLKILPS